MKTEEKQRSGVKVMLGLIGMVKPLSLHMTAALVMGTIGNLCAVFITVLGTYGLLDIFSSIGGGTLEAGAKGAIGLKTVCIAMVLLAVVRAILKYAEQAFNHYIAFKLLARIRDMIFAALRRITPSKLEGKEKGNLISLITSDVELLEVFYAHTISPIAIAVLTSIVMISYIGRGNWIMGFIAAVFYLLVGAVVPLVNGKLGEKKGQIYRGLFAKLNTIVLDNLRGMGEILQYNQAGARREKMEKHSDSLNHTQKKLKDLESTQGSITNTVIQTGGAVMLIVSGLLAVQGKVAFTDALLATVAMMSSFGPTAALSSLSNNLHQTLASGNRVLSLLEEEPLVEEIKEGAPFRNGTLAATDVSFSYPNSREERVLSHYSATFERGKITGIVGPSGCGKSTLLKLFMRFFETDKGSLTYQGADVNTITTSELRSHVSYVTQETHLFLDTIENNIRVAKQDATLKEIISACKKASIHDFIMKLPNGYQTKLSELGDSLSGGERQRIGIARAFLHDGDIMFLDEPTSNLDSLNEAVILKALAEEKEDKTVVLVSHRKSTMGIADKVITVGNIAV
ncbi:amino acid ABC transporter ATP-binding/permease protein [Konateibacter massiliensis]|uniref:amino acid ABC transporter ATP-binding/permease protein n=1 Tax=Konateibacter massiliensis TaxID=2002841 RepID=UPI000C15C2B5|nr:ABC transporter ATP-binding protein [Konateibacter massiliensis]